MIQMLEESLRSQEELACDERSRLTRKLNMAQDQVKKMKEMEEMMEVEIVDLKESKAVAHEEHKDNQDKMEKKHFEEKALLEERMSQICKEKLAIMESVHQEATKQFEAKIQTSLQEQHRLLDVIEKYKKDVHDLKHLKYSLADENAALKDKIRSMVKQNATRMEAQKAKLAELKGIIASLEQILELNNAKLEQQQETLKVNQVTIQASQVELEKLQVVLSLREKELAQIKKQALVIIKHRRELENFFYQALAHVKQEISTSKAQYKKEAQRDYCLKFREATAGKIKFPPVRTFHRSSHSTNCVYSDMEAAEPWPYPPGSEVEFSHLTWEQKEKVLKLLFAKMNTVASGILAASSEKKSLADSTAATV